jgi:hypothetical protein
MLTSLHIENAKPREKPYKLTDELGLHLLVPTTGSRLWRFRYHFSGKQNMLSLAPSSNRFRAFLYHLAFPHRK